MDDALTLRRSWVQIPFDPYSSGFIFEIQQKKKNSRTINSQIPNWINLECMKANEKANEQLKPCIINAEKINVVIRHVETAPNHHLLAVMIHQKRCDFSLVLSRKVSYVHESGL